MTDTAAELVLHYSKVMSSERICLCALLIVLFGMVIYREHRKSSGYLALTIALQAIQIFADCETYRYAINTHLPYAAAWVFYFLAYGTTSLTVLAFSLYAGAYIRERTPIHRWVFGVPVVLEALNFCIISAAMITGSVFGNVGGKIALVGEVPAVTTLLQFFVICYVPFAALTKVRQIGLKAVLVLGLFGIVPAVMMFISYDYSGSFGAMELLFVFILLQCDTSRQKAQQARELKAVNDQLNDALEAQNGQLDEIVSLNAQLKGNQAQLEEAADEQAAQLREITALNAQLEENQAEMEASVAEQEAQIEEISALNSELQAAQDRVSQAYGMIKGLSQEYHTIWVVEKETSKMRLVRSTGVSTIQNAVQMGRDFPEFDAGFEKYISTYVEPEDRERMRREIAFAEVLRHLEAQPAVLYAVNYLRRDDSGHVGYHQIAFANADTEDGLRQFVYGFRDIDAMVKAEQRQKQELLDARKAADAANRAKTSFLFSMSHDIRTPMNAIIGFANLMQKHLDDREKCRDYLGKIINSSDFLLDLINNVLEMARIESGNMTLDETPCSIRGFNDSLFTVFEEEMLRKGIRYTRSVDVRHECVFCDTTKTKEIYLNILSNALKYTPAGGSVSMDLRELPSDREGYALLRTTISDTGIGMSAEYLPHLFEEFSREKTATESRVQGTGLGMPIVKKLIDLMGGTISVESAPGKGTTFVVSLHHRIADPGAAEAAESASGGTADLAGRRLLLAEDNDLNAEIAMEILGETGAEVEWAKDGAICLSMLEQAPDGYYDLILMDIQMPNLDGYGAAKAIRQLSDPLKAEIPILAMTANAFDEDKKNALAAGMNGHLSKPIDVGILMRTLSDILG